jgi:hypothetical protein
MSTPSFALSGPGRSVQANATKEDALLGTRTLALSEEAISNSAMTAIPDVFGRTVRLLRAVIRSRSLKAHLSSAAGPGHSPSWTGRWPNTLQPRNSLSSQS